MSNNKQSSVEWYANEENKLFTSYQKGLMSTAKYILFKYKLREQAKAMHKEEIKTVMSVAFLDGLRSGDENYKPQYEEWEDYYVKAFGY